MLWTAFTGRTEGYKVRRESHPTDQELLLAAGGELSSRKTARVRGHIRLCPQCVGRVEELEGGVAEFTRAYRDSAEYSGAGDASRALLQARLVRGQNFAGRWPRPGAHAAIAALTISVVALGAVVGLEWRTRLRKSLQFDYEAQATPQISLTPGATRAVTWTEVCPAESKAMETARAVPETLKRRVFAEYGMSAAPVDAFEVDYLVTPELGGAQDIRNLWPQPYSETVWNARVKDDLEGRLHNLVCSGQIDLATAQQELSHDWISAYKKYFHSNKPL